MILQLTIMSEIRNLFYYLQSAGILDILIPFALIFTVLYAVTKKVHIFEQNDKAQIIISLGITLLVLIPHITGSIAPEYDVVQIINNSLPATVLIIFVLLTAMLLLGFVKGEKVAFGELATGILGIAGVIAVIVIYARAAGYFQGTMPYWLQWLDDPQLGALVVVILMFTLITWFIVKPSGGDGIGKNIEKLFNRIGKELWHK